jgi:hypothetical protein
MSGLLPRTAQRLALKMLNPLTQSVEPSGGSYPKCIGISKLMISTRLDRFTRISATLPTYRSKSSVTGNPSTSGPRAPISKRAYENDFLGEFSSGYDPLRALKYKIQQLDERPPVWWKPRGHELLDAARYPATDSVSEWADEILALDQQLNEGFLVKPLQKLAEDAGRSIDKQWKSLRLLPEYLESKGRSAEDARAVGAPLAKLHSMRNPLKGHGSTNERKAAQKQARSEHGTLRSHFTALTAQCDDALATIVDVFNIEMDPVS